MCAHHYCDIATHFFNQSINQSINQYISCCGCNCTVLYHDSTALHNFCSQPIISDQNQNPKSREFCRFNQQISIKKRMFSVPLSNFYYCDNSPLQQVQACVGYLLAQKTSS